LDIRSRFERFAAKVGEAARAQAPPAPKAPALQEGYWESVRELFTRDVTAQGLQELLSHDAPETFRYFTREVDLASLRGRPWYERWPEGAWRVFQALAYRLTPARRVVFAGSVILLTLGWVLHLTLAVGRWQGPLSLLPIHSGAEWTLVTATALFFLLVLELRDKLTLKGDLEIARQIQFGLLPFEPAELPHFVIRAAMRPANTVGGDYFDIVDLGSGRQAIVVGDVSGKGMPAALLMALLQGSLRTLSTAGLRGAELVAKLNAHLCANIPPNRLITLFYGELDADGGALRYVNAGHNPPFLVRGDGAVERLAPTAVALGVMADAEFQAYETTLDPGDRLLLYTDGVTEAADAEDVEYGEERLRAFLDARRDIGEPELLEALTAEVLRHCGPVRPRDDMTLLAVRRR
jgi:serine phosphatase RsbU (regulator of sigma subunit)